MGVCCRIAHNSGNNQGRISFKTNLMDIQYPMGDHPDGSRNSLGYT